MSVTDADASKHEISDADKQRLEQLRVAYETAQKNNSPDLDKAREAYQDLAIKLLVDLSGKLDITPGPDPGADPGYVKAGGWGSKDADANNWKVVNMKDHPEMFKVVDKDGVNVATSFKTKEGAQAYIDAAKKVPGGCPAGQHLDPATNKCVVDLPAPSGDKDQFGVLKIYKDKAGGETNTNFKLEVMTRHYASGKPSEDSCEYTAIASSNDHNSDVEFTCYEKINGFKTNEPDTISDKLTGPPHTDGAKSWVIAEFMTDGSAKATFETEYPHPKYQKLDPKPATAIGGPIIGKWFGHKHITYVKDGDRYCETWIHFPVKDINNIGAEQDGWRQYVKPFKVDKKFVPANGKLTTSRLDGIKKDSPPDFKYTSVREIAPSSGGGPPEPGPGPNPNPNPNPNPTPGKEVKARMAIAEMVGNTYDVYYAATEEIIEDMTNPYTNAVDPAGWVNGSDDEICDACDDNTFMKSGEPLTYPNGAFGSPYYSNSDGNCVIPGVGTKGGYSGKGQYKNTGKLPVIPAADVFIIFWGVAGSWDNAATGPRSVAHITKTITDLFTATDYVSGLKQYGITGPINVIGHIVDTTTPMTPKYDFIKGTTQVIQKAINEKKAPTTSANKIIYLVITDAIKGQKSNQAPNTGDHSEITITIP